MQKIDFVNAQEPAINDTNLNLMQLNIENAINAQVSGDTLSVGCIVPFASDTVPENWLLCDGQAVSRTDYALLFSIIGTTYGVGDGSTTFNLPNLKGRVAVGKDSTQTEFDNLGETGGEKTHTLTVQEMPSHSHNVEHFVVGTNAPGYNTWEENISSGTGASYKASARTNSTGGGQAHNILQPYQVTNYIIKARQSSGLVATVVDSLDSASTTNALSANQGKELKEMITGVEVFDGNSNGNITLSQSCQGAKFMEIFYSDNLQEFGYTKVTNPNGKKVNLTISTSDSRQTGMWIKIKTISINNNTITNQWVVEFSATDGVVSAVNRIYINKVILYF